MHEAEILLDNGADPTMQNDAGECRGGNWSKKTAGDTELQPIVVDIRDKTPLHIACDEQDDQEMATLLLERVRKWEGAGSCPFCWILPFPR